MEAGKLSCPQCGAPSAPDLAKCPHCGIRLAKVACASCFAMIFEGARFCAFCGAEPARLQSAKTKHPCPKCKTSVLAQVELGHTPVKECAKCHGLWVDASTFDRICTDRERQSAVLGSASEMFRPDRGNLEMAVRYVKCPECNQLMHRVNFAKCSGIILDVCKGHGTWFDRDELQHIVEFIRTGGLDHSRNKEKEELEAARRRMEASRSVTAMERKGSYDGGGGMWDFREPDLLDIAGSIIRMLR
ncbi:MAG: zf-TFIIB domain-containing protein [Limisphaerales bacterium]